MIYDIDNGVLPEPTAGPFTRTDGDALACWEVGPDTVWLQHDGFVLSRVRDRLPADPVAFSFAVVAAHAYRREDCPAVTTDYGAPYSCTREEGHQGSHMAEGDSAVLCVWEES